MLDVELSDPTRHDVPPGRLLIIRNVSEFSNSACDVYDGFLHPEFATIEPTTDPYDRSRDVPADGEGCRVVSRT
ncbi:hypothetical protein ACFW2X_13665 [Streptomyces antibioticus]|uniref:hypothetical protein n=1 Tax=Streptomyces antibioticus TaxID=1890 RepID=UPI0036CE07CD